MLQDENEPDIVTQFIDGFLADLPDRLVDLHRAIEGRDAHAVRIAAHALKGSSSLVGAVALAEFCGALEEMGRSGAVGGIDAAAGPLEGLADRSRAALLECRDPAIPVPA